MDKKSKQARVRRAILNEVLIITSNERNIMVVHEQFSSPLDETVCLKPGDVLAISIVGDSLAHLKLSGVEEAVFVDADGGGKIVNQNYLYFPNHKNPVLHPLGSLASAQGMPYRVTLKVCSLSSNKNNTSSWRQIPAFQQRCIY